MTRRKQPASARGSDDPRDYSGLVRATFFRPVSVLMLFVALLVVGLLAYPRIPLEFLPSGLSSGQCGVYIPVDDATPQEVMEQIAKPCEDLLRTLPGLRQITSSSGPRRCFLRMEFDARYDMGFVVAEVRDRLDRARASWIEGVDQYYVWRHHDAELPAYIVSLGLEIAPENEAETDLDFIFDEVIRKRIEAISGVARVHVWGLLDKRVEIALDKTRVDAHGIDLRRLIERLTNDNRSITSGDVIDGDREILVRFDGQFGDFEEVLDFPVGRKFRIGDFADVRESRAVRDRLSRVNGQLSRVVVINKDSSANAVEVCDRLERAFTALEEELRRTVPGLVRTESHAWLNQGEMISTSVGSLRESGLFGGAFAVVILFVFFRRVGLTLLVTMAIPFSLLIALVWIFFTGGSFNLLSLMGLSLGIGMLVDNSVVVVESILRKRETGLRPRAAAIAGVSEVALAVAMATLTTVMVFLPLIFLGDARFRRMTSEIGIPLCVSVLASLLVALVFIPQGAIYLERATRAMKRDDHTLEARPTTYSRANRWTAALLRLCLRRRLESFLIALGLLVTTITAFQMLPKAASDMDGPRRLQLRVELPINGTLQEANDTFREVEESIRASGGHFGIRSLTSWFDARGGEVNVFLEPGRRVDERKFFEVIRPALPRRPGVTYHLGFEDFAQDKGEQRIRVFIEGNDYYRLEEASSIIEAALEDKSRFPELANIDRWRDEERDEVRIQVHRRAAQQLGVDTASVSRMVSWALRGAPLPDFVQGDREYPFWIRYADADKESVEDLKGIRVFRPTGAPVRLENLAHYVVEAGAGDIHRRNGKMTAGFSAHVEHGDPFVVRQLVEQRLQRIPLPQGCEATLRPPRGGFEEELRNTTMALLLAICLVFFVMGILFESWVLPFSVLVAVPFSFFGSAWFLVITGIRLDGVAMIGTLMLVGVVVNNAIVLVDFINRLREDGERRNVAIVRAVQIRFRPIWMTALTTIFGLMPLLVVPQRGEGVDYKALAALMVGGLTTSTFFTLFMVPLLYALLDNLRRVTWSALAGLRAHRRAVPA